MNKNAFAQTRAVSCITLKLDANSSWSFVLDSSPTTTSYMRLLKVHGFDSKTTYNCLFDNSIQDIQFQKNKHF